MQIILKKIYKYKLFKRILPSILKRLIRIFKINSIIIRHEEILLNLNLNNPIDREIYLKGDYEREQIALISDLIDQHKIEYFLDIGAHMGYYSIKLSEKEIKIYAFEPVKNNYEQLKKNKLINKFTNLEIYNFALSNENKNIVMWVPDINKTGGFSILDDKDEEINKYDKENLIRINSSSRKGDEIINLKNHKIAIKIDVERHEKYVLEGLNNLLSNNMVILQIELFDKRKNNIQNYLEEKKFKIFKIINQDHYFKNFW